MTRKFYYHPDRFVEVGTALLLGRLVATSEQLVADYYMPLEDSKGNQVMGWWVDCFEPEDFFLIRATLLTAPVAVDFPKMVENNGRLIFGG